MGKLLVLNANSKEESLSRTMKITNAFINSYKENNPNDIVEKVDLYDLDFPDIDKEVMNAMESDSTGDKIKDKLEKRDKILKQFKCYDKIVISAPMWNFLYPSVLKKWIDAVVVANETFKYTKNGPVGLSGDKKVVFIQSTGGNYAKRPEENFGLNHIKKIINFMGIDNFYTITAYGMDIGQKDKNLPIAIKDAEELAKEF